MKERLLEKTSKEKSNKLIMDKLDENEQIEKVIELRNIDNIKAVTVASAFGGTMGNSMDYGLGNRMYFTNKKVHFVSKNVGGEPLASYSKDRDDILGIVFTNRKVKVKKDDNGSLGIQVTRDKLKVTSIIMSILFISYMMTCLVSKTVPIYILALLGTFTLIWTIAKCIQDILVDRIKIAMNDGHVLDVLLASNDYKEAREYLKNISKAYKYKKDGI